MVKYSKIIENYVIYTLLTIQPSLPQNVQAYVNLGIYKEDENSVDGMLKILEKFSKYLPKLPDGRKVEIAVYGDGLTTERMNNAKDSRVNSDNNDAKYLSLISANSQWHKRVLLLQDDFNALMKGQGSGYSEGTLAWFKSRFNHSLAFQEVKRDFNHGYKLIKFALHAYVIAYAMKELAYKTGKIEEIPDHLSTQQKNSQEMLTLLDRTATKIVKFGWHNVWRAAEQTKYCVCQVDWNPAEEEEYIGCDNLECSIQWYHKSCLIQVQGKTGNKLRQPPQEKKKKAKKDNKEGWVCSLECKKALEDKKLLYTKALMFAGLNHESYKANIRCNNGPGMIRYNKMHMILFHNRNHSMYWRIHHRILAAQAGVGSALVSHDLTHNSTINWCGGEGRCLEYDLANEFQNKSMKATMSGAQGSLTDNALERRSQVLRVSAEISKELQQQVNEDDFNVSSNSKEYCKIREDVQEGAAIISENKLFDAIAGRSHAGYKDFTYNGIYVHNIVAVKAAIDKNSAILDQLNLYASETRAAATPGTIAN